MKNTIPDILGDISHRYNALMRDIPAAVEIGLTPFQLRALVIIGRNPGCSQQILAKWSGRDKAQIARAIKELEAQALITRRTSELNWRTLEMNLTDKGECIFMAAKAHRNAILTEMMANITSEESQLLLAILEKMQHGLENTFTKME